MSNKKYIAAFLALFTCFIAIINLFGLMRLIPLYITIPLLFLSIYLTVFTITYRNAYRGRRK